MRIRLGRRLIELLLARAIDFLDSFLFFGGLILRQFATPAHLLRDFFFGFIGIAIFIEQFSIFIRARIGFFHEPLVIVFVPLGFGIFLPALMLFNDSGKFLHEAVHPSGSL